MASTPATIPRRRRRLDPALFIKRFVAGFPLYGFLSLLALITVLPFVYALFASFKPLKQMMADGPRLLPTEWHFDNYVKVWEAANFSKYFLNTAYVVVLVILLDLAFSSMLGYVLARKQGQMRIVRIVEVLFGFTIFLGLGTISLYPIFLIALNLGLLNLNGVVLVTLAGLTAIHTLLIKAYCQSLSNEVYEAATLDGCSFFGIYWRIAFPLIRPILAVVAIFAFQAAWNDFQVPFVFTLSNPDLRTMVIGVVALRSTGAGGAAAWDLMVTGTVLSIIPIIIVFIVLQKYFMRGMTEGAVKG